MAYALHIEVPGDEIEEEEWTHAVSLLDNVRFANNDVSATNPGTGEVISIGTGPLDAELHFSASDEWLPTFWWFDGRVQFKASPGFEEAVLPTALRLAEAMGATVRGDEGETYST